MSEKILLVEDNDMLQEILSARLGNEAFDVKLASNGLEAFDLAKSFRPDIILMDMSLPFMDGWEVTKAIRETAEISGTPIIALTAHAMVSEKERGLDAGVNLYLTKPIDFQKLLAKINELLAARKIEN